MVRTWKKNHLHSSQLWALGYAVLLLLSCSHLECSRVLLDHPVTQTHSLSPALRNKATQTLIFEKQWFGVTLLSWKKKSYIFKLHRKVKGNDSRLREENVKPYGVLIFSESRTLFKCTHSCLWHQLSILWITNGFLLVMFEDGVLWWLIRQWCENTEGTVTLVVCV